MNDQQLNVLSLQPWYGGSHRQFADGWSGRSIHRWTTLGLPDRNWKWRMRHASIEFAKQIGQRTAKGESWNVVICTDMMNAAELQSLAPSIRELPLIVYFHENQFAYPIRGKHQPDHHFLFTNFVSALAANEVWFNSQFNLDSMIRGLNSQREMWPDFSPIAEIASINANAKVVPPPISFPDCDVATMIANRKSRVLGGEPLHLVWAARWEYDKDPAALLECLELLAQQRVPFRLSVIGQQADSVPKAFDTIHEKFALQIENWGYQDSRESYWSVLESADVFLSTSAHEFFGISAAESIAAGAWPLLPHRLAYPELLQIASAPNRKHEFTYPQTIKQLASKIRELHRDRNWNFAALEELVRDTRERLAFESRVLQMDQMLLNCVNG
ncbi:tRNA-queuosine alpha-mannosyltransferase domain-containing protein [Mariniblastus fucicola]|uniref:tRNA-queuosine alpha-mannosyltransferase n=1 Tax=Mariniblastus fucicola TaxID=980251 RepID=A0A5B9PFY6_9BACT|nr:DUF3524 domain-containing protein [Mariniblastus fucicola]QEG21861.1 Glycosyl transferases group 1 [Mariniblastus fucicola]